MTWQVIKREALFEKVKLNTEAVHNQERSNILDRREYQSSYNYVRLDLSCQIAYSVFGISKLRVIKINIECPGFLGWTLVVCYDGQKVFNNKSLAEVVLEPCSLKKTKFKAVTPSFLSLMDSRALFERYTQSTIKVYLINSFLH